MEQYCGVEAGEIRYIRFAGLQLEIYHNDAWLVTILLRLCSMGDASLYNNSFLWISQMDVTQLFSTPATLSVEDKAAPLVGVRS